MRVSSWGAGPLEAGLSMKEAAHQLIYFVLASSNLITQFDLTWAVKKLPRQYECLLWQADSDSSLHSCS